MTQLPVKALDSEFLMTFPGYHIPHVLSHFSAGGIKCVWPHWERTLGSLHLVSPGFCPIHLSLLSTLLGILAVNTTFCQVLLENY